MEAGDRWHKGSRARGDNNALGAENPVTNANMVSIFYRGCTGNAVNAEFGVARHRVFRLDGPDRCLDPLHHLRKVDFRYLAGDAITIRMAHLMGNLGGTNQRFTGHTAGVQANTLLMSFHFFRYT